MLLQIQLNKRGEFMKIRIFEPKFNQSVKEMILDIQQNEFLLPITLSDQPDLNVHTKIKVDSFGWLWIAAVVM